MNITHLIKKAGAVVGVMVDDSGEQYCVPIDGLFHRSFFKMLEADGYTFIAGSGYELALNGTPVFQTLPVVDLTQVPNAAAYEAGLDGFFDSWNRSDVIPLSDRDALAGVTLDFVKDTDVEYEINTRVQFLDWLAQLASDLRWGVPRPNDYKPINYFVAPQARFTPEELYRNTADNCSMYLNLLEQRRCLDNIRLKNLIQWIKSREGDSFDTSGENIANYYNKWGFDGVSINYTAGGKVTERKTKEQKLQTMNEVAPSADADSFAKRRTNAIYKYHRKVYGLIGNSLNPAANKMILPTEGVSDTYRMNPLPDFTKYEFDYYGLANYDSNEYYPVGYIITCDMLVTTINGQDPSNGKPVELVFDGLHYKIGHTVSDTYKGDMFEYSPAYDGLTYTDRYSNTKPAVASFNQLPKEADDLDKYACLARTLSDKMYVETPTDMYDYLLTLGFSPISAVICLADKAGLINESVPVMDGEDRVIDIMQFFPNDAYYYFKHKKEIDEILDSYEGNESDSTEAAVYRNMNDKEDDSEESLNVEAAILRAREFSKGYFSGITESSDIEVCLREYMPKQMILLPGEASVAGAVYYPAYSRIKLIRDIINGQISILGDLAETTGGSDFDMLISKDSDTRAYNIARYFQSIVNCTDLTYEDLVKVVASFKHIPGVHEQEGNAYMLPIRSADSVVNIQIPYRDNGYLLYTLEKANITKEVTENSLKFFNISAVGTEYATSADAHRPVAIVGRCIDYRDSKSGGKTAAGKVIDDMVDKYTVILDGGLVSEEQHQHNYNEAVKAVRMFVLMLLDANGTLTNNGKTKFPNEWFSMVTSDYNSYKALKGNSRTFIESLTSVCDNMYNVDVAPNRRFAYTCINADITPVSVTPKGKVIIPTTYISILWNANDNLNFIQDKINRGMLLSLHFPGDSPEAQNFVGGPQNFWSYYYYNTNSAFRLLPEETDVDDLSGTSGHFKLPRVFLDKYAAYNIMPEEYRQPDFEGFSKLALNLADSGSLAAYVRNMSKIMEESRRKGTHMCAPLHPAEVEYSSVYYREDLHKELADFIPFGVGRAWGCYALANPGVAQNPDGTVTYRKHNFLVRGLEESSRMIATAEPTSAYKIKRINSLPAEVLMTDPNAAFISILGKQVIYSEKDGVLAELDITTGKYSFMRPEDLALANTKTHAIISCMINGVTNYILFGLNNTMWRVYLENKRTEA